jgi:TonB family protein
MRTAGLLAATLSSIVLAACGGSERAPAQEPVAPRHVVDDEEEPDDGLELEHARGHMEPADVEAGMSPHAGELEQCYASQITKKTRWLGGTVELKWQIQRDGTLTSVQVASGDLGSWTVEKCLLEVARSMTFKPPKGGDADFSVPLEFTARGASQWWDEDKATTAVGIHLDELATCAEEAATEDPGDVTVVLYVGTRGKVQSVGFATSALVPFSDAWADCAVAKAMAWVLPDPRGAVAKLAVRYRPGEGAATESVDEEDE